MFYALLFFGLLFVKTLFYIRYLMPVALTSSSFLLVDICMLACYFHKSNMNSSTLHDRLIHLRTSTL